MEVVSTKGELRKPLRVARAPEGPGGGIELRLAALNFRTQLNNATIWFAGYVHLIFVAS